MARILIVEDDRQVRDLFITILEDAGYNVLGVADGNSALKELAADHFDLILTDIIMPEKDGIELIMELRLITDRPAIIAISCGSHLLDVNNILTLVRLMKVELVLAKPISRTQLLEAVATVLASRSLSHSPA